MLSCAAFYSCRNISAQDFGRDDISNMLEVLLKDKNGEYIPEPTEPTEITEPTETTEPAGLTEPTEPEEVTEPVNPPEQTNPTNTTSPANTTEPTEPVNQPEPETFATVIDILSVFSGAPEKFRHIPFPEAVRMTDILKNNIKELADFSPRDFGGAPFYTATTNAKLFTPLYNGSMLSDARRYRTELVDAACGVSVISLEKPSESFVQDLRLNVQSGEVFSDIICVPLDIQSELVRNGLVMNLKKTPFLNLNSEYYNQSANEAFTVNGNTYGLVSDFTFDPESIYAVYFNRTLIKKYGLTNPSDLYKDGAWNYDEMINITKEFISLRDSDSYNNNTLPAIEFDRENASLFNGLFIVSGNKYFMQRNNNFPILNYNNDRTLRFLRTISGAPGILGNGDYNNNPGENGRADFKNGDILFSFSKLGLITEIADSPFDWGLLPVPAVNPDANANPDIPAASSFADNGAMGISIPVNARNTEAGGIVISALSAASYRQLKDIYVLEQMTYNLRDVESVNILEDIVNNIAFSQYNAYSAIPEIYNATAGLLKSASENNAAFAGLYDSARTDLNEFFRTSDIFRRS